jgi:hypothetical protein
MKSIYYILLSSCLLFSCQKGKEHIQSGDEDIAIQHIKWKSQKDFDIKNLVESIQYIPLEDNAESIFASIDKLVIENNRIYILDISGTKSLFVFDMEGKFLHKIGTQGEGPGEYTNYINFDVFDNEVYVYDNAKRQMLIYDENGNYKRYEKSSFSFFDFQLLFPKKYLLSLDIHEKNNDNKRILITDDLKKKKITHFTHSKDFKNDKLNVRVFHSFQGKTAYMLPVSDTLFILNEQGNVENGYFFDFGDQKLPDELKSSYGETVKQRQYHDYIYIYNAPIKIKQYIFTDLFIGNQKYIAAFDIENNKSSYELITPENYTIENINFPLYAMNDSILVSYIDYSLYDLMKDKISFPPQIVEHLSKEGVALCLYKIK